MPGRHTSPMDQNTQCIAADLRDRLSVTERCARDGASRNTGYNWVDRDLTHGPQGLAARSRRPCPSPRHTPDQGVAASLDARCRQPSWGAEQLGAIRCQRPPHWPWPARSTSGDLRSRHGAVPQQRTRRAIGPPGQPISSMGAPNAVWSADCTGPLQTGDGRDGYRRFWLGGQALSATHVQEATPVCTRVCKAFGLPPRSRPDHGGPLAPNTRTRRSPWSAGWGRLGLFPEVSPPGQPPPHGRHARLPRTLTAEPTRPPGATRRAPPRQFHPGRAECTHERPPEALDRRTPAACDAPAPREMPHTRLPRDDPDRFEVRYVSAHGGRRGHRQGGNGSPTCAGA